MSNNNSGIYCVGIWLVGGMRHSRVFDDYDQAKYFMASVVKTNYHNGEVEDVALWEM